MQNEERIKGLRKLIENGGLITTGGMIGIPLKVPPDAPPEAAPVVVFVEKTPEGGIDGSPNETWLATPIGVPLFEAGEFHEWCKDHAKDTFLKNFDRMLKSKTSSGLK